MITEKDVEIFDFLTHSYRTFVLINDLTNTLFSDIEQKRVKSSPASQFYFQWCQRRLDGRRDVPLNPGLILMITWAIVVTTRERWLELLPETPFSKSDPEWGLKEAQLKWSKNPDPPINKVVKKMRNALSHSDFEVKLSKAEFPWGVVVRDSKIIFRDSKGRDDFELMISFSDLSKLNSKVYQTIEAVIDEYTQKRNKKSTPS
jgi:hypothetical protein